jgi:hypothetical protein
MCSTGCRSARRDTAGAYFVPSMSQLRQRVRANVSVRIPRQNTVTREIARQRRPRILASPLGTSLPLPDANSSSGRGGDDGTRAYVDDTDRETLDGYGARNVSRITLVAAVKATCCR